MFIEIQIKLIIVILMGLASLRLFARKRGSQRNAMQSDSKTKNQLQQNSEKRDPNNSWKNQSEVKAQKINMQQQQANFQEKVDDQQKTMARIRQKLMEISIKQIANEECTKKQEKIFSFYRAKNVYLQSIIAKSGSPDNLLYKKYLPVQQTPLYPQAIHNQVYFDANPSILNRPVNFYSSMDIEQDCCKNQSETKLFRLPFIDLKPKIIKKTKMIAKSQKVKKKHHKWRKQWIRKTLKRFVINLKKNCSIKMRWQSHQELWNFINSQWECYRQNNIFKDLNCFFQGLDFENYREFQKWFIDSKIQDTFLDYFKNQFNQHFQVKNNCKMMIYQQKFIDQFKRYMHRQYVRMRCIKGTIQKSQK